MKETIYNEEEGDMPLLCPIQWVITEEEVQMPLLSPFSGLLPEKEEDTPLLSRIQWVITGERGRKAPPLSYSMGNNGGRGTHTPPQSFSMGYYRRKRKTRPSLVVFNRLLPEKEGDTSPP